MKGTNVLIFLIQIALVYCQTVRKASLLQHKAYMIEVIEKTAQEVEDYQWCNLKIPEFSQDVEYDVFGRNFSGTVTYKNGYVVTIQHIDVTENSVQQTWTWRSATKVGQVEVKGLMRLHDVMIGFDVEVILNGKPRRYTSTFTHRLVNINFSILKNMSTQNMTVTATASQPVATTNKMSYAPTDSVSDLLGTSFQPVNTRAGVIAWGTDVFTPIAHDVVTTKVEFPKACYNC